MTNDLVLRRTELLLPGPAQALAALLGVSAPDLDRGDPLPMAWHWIYLLDRPAQSDIGPDGHPFRNTLPSPPAPGQRRMWAGGRVRHHGPLRCGMAATKETAVLSTREKEGRSGRLTIVTVGHRIDQGGQTVVEEEQDIVYRPAATASSVAPDTGEEPPFAPDAWRVEVSPTLLFRFSALTYNAHRIHYDRDYARDEEGYPGLLTHGPLQAIAMAEAVRARSGAQYGEYAYRLTAPLFDHQGMLVMANTQDADATAEVRDRHGRRTATGTLRGAR